MTKLIDWKKIEDADQYTKPIYAKINILFDKQTNRSTLRTPL
jgi:hypothetical protein